MITTHLSDLTILACWLVIVATAFLGWGRFVGGLLGQSVVKPLTQRNLALEIVCGIWIGLCFCDFLASQCRGTWSRDCECYQARQINANRRALDDATAKWFCMCNEGTPCRGATHRAIHMDVCGDDRPR